MTTITETRTDGAEFLGNYRILRPLGRGGMGDVYLAWSGLRLVAIKILHSHHASDATFVAMFLAEAKVAGRINHSGIAQVLDVGVDGGRLYMVMEYVAGHTLDELIRDTSIVSEDPPSLFPLRIGASVFAFVAHALATAHRAQVIHRDISPHNLLVSDTGALKIIDFGIARTQSSDAMTSPGTFRGRFGYMAPEYVQGLHCDHRVDLFALGVVMWETFARQRLYPGAAAAQLYSLIERPAERLDEAIPGFPTGLADIVDRLLQREPGDRYDDAGQVARALEDLLPTLPDGGFRNLAHWVGHHLSRRIDARARTDHDELQRIAADEAAAEEAYEPVVEIHPATSDAAGAIQSPGSMVSGRGITGRWPFLIALLVFGLAMATGAVWLVTQARPRTSSSAELGPHAVALPLPEPEPPAPTRVAPVMPTQVPVAPEPVVELDPAPPTTERDEPTEATRRRGAKNRHEPREPDPTHRTSVRSVEPEEPATVPVPPTVAPVAAPLVVPPPLAPTVTTPPSIERPSTLPTVVPPPPPPPATTLRTPRVPASMAGDEARGAAVLGQCNACHTQNKTRRIEGKYMTRSQWERFFRNGTHDRYQPLGGRLGVSDLAAAKAYLGARALDASEDQSAGVR